MIAMNDTCVTRHKSVGHAICTALRNEAVKMGFDPQLLPAIAWDALVFSVQRDPADGADCLTGEWKTPAGQRIGQVRFNSDGSFFAEHDIVLAHPNDERWFVEAVEAWGRDSQISAEPRLLAAV